MKQALFIISCLVYILFAACDRLDGLDEGDRNTYTWKGTIYEGYSDEPLKNTPLYLQASYAGVPVGKTEVIGETTTDENGHYSITYRRLKGLVENVGLYVENGQFSNLPIETADVNKNLDRNISTTKHSRIQLSFIGEPHFDSIIIAPTGLVEAESPRFNISMKEKSKGKFLIFNLKEIDNTFFKCQVVSSRNDLNNWGFNYYTGEKDLQLARKADTSESIEYEIKKFNKYISIFPDTAIIVIDAIEL
ncbi:MAG: hypothetical protein Salg2KO_03240 [Salibacteraceae bacterium]